MPFASLVGNERIKMLLRRAVADGRVGQGLIMAGPHGVGKRQFALALAQALNCERPVEGDACGKCVPCRRVASGEHTDVETISPDGQFIKIDQMRDMARQAQYRPYESRRRVYIIDDADRLREQAANSILKTLEEPPETTMIILVTSKPYTLLETIRSRCQMLSFAPLSVPELEAHLKANYKRPAEETRMLARLARGSLGRALEIDLGQYKERRKTMTELVETLGLTRDSVRLMNAAEYLGRKLERDEFEVHLDVLMVLLSDIFHLKLGEPPESLTNSDAAERLGRISEAVTLDEIMDWAGRVETVMQSLSRNVNRHLAMEVMLLAAAGGQ
ncbi:MAG TPA: DNA polymerase III subunit delta' [Blastocatellia bacterium]|nr:DNA polymerase III subunit delta' [Blastocatellia bacterium]